MFPKRSYKPCMKGSFSGGRDLTSSFINDQCLWGFPGPSRSRCFCHSFSPCLSPCLAHSPCMPGWPLSWAHPADPAERTIMHYETEGTEYMTKNNPQDYLSFAFTSFLLCISVWRSDCSVSTCKVNVAWDVLLEPYVGPAQENREEQKAL